MFTFATAAGKLPSRYKTSNQSVSRLRLSAFPNKTIGVPKQDYRRSQTRLSAFPNKTIGVPKQDYRRSQTRLSAFPNKTIGVPKQDYRRSQTRLSAFPNKTIGVPKQDYRRSQTRLSAFPNKTIGVPKQDYRRSQTRLSAFPNKTIGVPKQDYRRSQTRLSAFPNKTIGVPKQDYRRSQTCCRSARHGIVYSGPEASDWTQDTQCRATILRSYLVLFYLHAPYVEHWGASLFARLSIYPLASFLVSHCGSSLPTFRRKNRGFFQVLTPKRSILYLLLSSL